MPLTVVTTAPGTSTAVNSFLLRMKPCVSPFTSSYSPAIAFVLFPLAAVEMAPGTSMVVKAYCAVAVLGMPVNRPSATDREHTSPGDPCLDPWGMDPDY